MLRQHSKWFAVSTVIVFLLTGCGGSEFTTAEVKGTVVFEDAPVTGGTVTFIPVNADGSPREGKAAVGTIGDGGVFVLRTYEDGDGAIIGKHQVIYSTPEEVSDEIVGIEVDAKGRELSVAHDDSPALARGRDVQLRVAEESSIVEVKDIESNTIKIVLAPISTEEEKEHEE